MSELMAAVVEYKFRTDDEEILFFKTVKLLFASELEYYSLLFHSLLFCPPDSEGARKFWERESSRLEEFKNLNRIFLDYHASGRTEMDKIYYLVVHEIGSTIKDYNVPNKEPKPGTGYDLLIAKLLALERYNNYVQKN